MTTGGGEPSPLQRKAAPLDPRLGTYIIPGIVQSVSLSLSLSLSRVRLVFFPEVTGRLPAVFELFFLEVTDRLPAVFRTVISGGYWSVTSCVLSVFFLEGLLAPTERRVKVLDGSADSATVGGNPALGLIYFGR